ncbi:MAG: biopolymer transporter ExbD [Deltaproteobacteria bacterium]|nr:MAG: biopolymer transporter ExbD [Deltaproteobacteria bacterium]TMQ04581.1 MAG: biopolymer transporter ExbD [Deltaproteobacteria bacterium]
MKADDGDELNAEINVTPFVDVMLVLLIIFMITAPMMNNTGVELQLPQVAAKNLEDPEGKLVLSIKVSDEIFLGGTRVTWQDLAAKLKANERVKREGALYIEADTNLAYGVVLTAMAIAKDSGVEKVMMLTDPSDQLKLSDLDQRADKARH